MANWKSTLGTSTQYLGDLVDNKPQEPHINRTLIALTALQPPKPAVNRQTPKSISGSQPPLQKYLSASDET